MNLSKASDSQLKNILEWDEGCSNVLLYPIYEECVKRDLYNSFIIGFLIKLYGSTKKAEQLTRLSVDEIKWLSYEQGFKILKVFKPGNRPFIAAWSHVIKYKIHEIIRKQYAKKRTGEEINIDEMVIGIPSSNHDTEKTAINRVYIEFLFQNLRPFEKEIVLARYQGFTLDEIGAMQGVTTPGIQKRIKTYVKRLREVEGNEFKATV
nr:hypothetical protein [Heyndrickxia oleronia]